MQIEAMLLAKHAKSTAVEVADLVVNHPDAFMPQYIAAFCSSNKIISQRAAWSLRLIAQQNANLLAPYWGELLQKATQPNLHDATKRNIACTLKDLGLAAPAKHLGQAIDLCFTWLQNPAEAIATKCYAMRFLAQIAQKKCPDLEPELIAIVQQNLPYGSAAYKASSQQILKKIMPK